MKNYIQEGDCFEVVTPSGGYTSGQIVTVGDTAGIAAGTYVEGQVAIIKTKGVYEVAKDTFDSPNIAQGAKLYFDDAAAGVATTTESTNAFLGYAHVASSANETTVKVLLAI